VKELDKPSIEILSPFNNEEVGLYETVRGRVFPPDSDLQAVVLAGNNRWYLQSPVVVRGCIWSVKCQFGDPDNSRKGSYKVVILLGHELKGGVSYSELPIGTPRSNTITVHKPKVTIEQKLATALSERDDYKDQLSKARADAESHKVERTGILIEKNMLADQVKELQESLELANKKLTREEIETGNWIQSCTKAERELADLRWLESRMKIQGEQLDTWVRITHVKCVKLQLTETPRIIFLALWVRNGSIFDITFDFNHLAGRLHFKNRPFNDQIRVPPSQLIDVVSPGDRIEIVIEQPLLATEAETVLDAQKSGDLNGIFWLGNLHIPIRTTHSPQSFNNKLRLHSEIEIQHLKDFP
jgi:hypothetical protein